MLFREANAIRTNVAYYRWTHDLVAVTGPDALAMLDRLYVNSIYKTAVGRTKYTTMLNHEGRIKDDVIVMHMAEDLYWVSTLYAPQLVAWANAQKGGLQVEFRDISTENHMYAIQGPNSLAMVNDLLETPVDDMKRFQVADNKVRGIRANSISPGGVMTDIAFALPPQNEYGKEKCSSLLIHSGEMALPEDLASAILFFASEDSRFVNGVDMAVDGGWTCF